MTLGEWRRVAAPAKSVIQFEPPDGGAISRHPGIKLQKPAVKFPGARRVAEYDKANSGKSMRRASGN